MSKKVEKSIQHAFYLLYFGFVFLAVWAGVDKIFNISQTWQRYLSPLLLQNVPLPPETILFIVGVIELIAGVTMLVSPRRGALVMAFWLMCIIGNLATIGLPVLDIIIRDLVLFLAAVTFYKLSVIIALT